MRTISQASLYRAIAQVYVATCNHKGACCPLAYDSHGRLLGRPANYKG